MTRSMLAEWERNEARACPVTRALLYVQGLPVSQIWAFTVFPSTLIDLVANSTPIVDFDSRLNSLRVNRESTGKRHESMTPSSHATFFGGHTVTRWFQTVSTTHGKKKKRLTTFRHQSHQWGRPIEQCDPKSLIFCFVLKTYFEKIIVIASLSHC